MVDIEWIGADGAARLCLVLVMLDLDNTLADRFSAVSAWAREFADQRQLPQGTAEWIVEMDRDGYADRKTVFEAIRARCELSEPVEDLLRAYRSRVVELTRLSVGASSCLNTLRSAGHVLAIVTNGSSQQQHAKIEALGLSAAVDAVVVSADIGIAKPNRAIFEFAATKAGASLDDSWMVGDSAANDIMGPTSLGVRTAWLHRGRAWSQQRTTPTVTLDSLADLPEALSSRS